MSLLTASSAAQHRSRRLDLADRLAEQQAMPGNVEPLVQALESALWAAAAKRFALAELLADPPNRPRLHEVDGLLVLLVELVAQRILPRHCPILPQSHAHAHTS